MRYTVAGMFFVGFAGKGIRGIFGDIGSLVPMLILLVAFVILFRTSGRSLSLRRFPTTISFFVAWCALTSVWSIDPLLSAQYSVMQIVLTLVSIAVAVALPLTALVEHSFWPFSGLFPPHSFSRLWSLSLTWDLSRPRPCGAEATFQRPHTGWTVDCWREGRSRVFLETATLWRLLRFSWQCAWCCATCRRGGPCHRRSCGSLHAGQQCC